MLARLLGPFITLAVLGQALADPAPPTYLDATAHYILQDTHNNQSGYFSLCEGKDGTLYIGTAKYGENAYLVEFDPRTSTQRIVVDVNQVCGLTAKDYAAQAKIHTRNFVGPRTGIIYVGSKQGYRIKKDDTSEYMGGYAIAYDPRTGSARNLGMPFEKQGIADIVADEERDLAYVVTCEDQHWMLGSASKAGTWKELGPMLTPYAMTLLAADGRAYAITKDFELACYDPATQKVSTAPIETSGERWIRKNNAAIPTWQLSPDRRSAYLILMNDPTLLQIPLDGASGKVAATSFGKMIDGKNPDSRCGLDVGPDGKVYAIVRIDNTTGFGKGYLHHIVRFDPQTKAHEDLGVVRVKNKDFFDFSAKGADGKPLPWTHGFHTLPDGSLTPLHAHMALMAARDGSLYVTIIYPFTLLKIDAAKPAKADALPAQREIDAALSSVDRIEQLIPQITPVAETIAARHLKGGLIGLPFPEQPIMQELYGRSGNMMHIGWERGWKKDRTEEEKKQDIAIVAYDRPAGKNDAATLKKLKDRGVYIVGFGPAVFKLAECDAWIDPGTEPGLRSTVGNALVGWTLMAETVSSLTRQGKMPTMFKSWAHPDGKDWSEPLFRKVPFHDDLKVPPVATGELGRRFLQQIRYPLRQLDVAALRQAAVRVSDELKAGRKTTIAWQGHMPMCYVGKLGTERWAVAAELHPFLDSQIASYTKNTPDGALVLSLGYHGVDPKGADVWKTKKQHVIHLTGDHPDPAWRRRDGIDQWISLGFAFGDACTTLNGYPIPLFAPSGVAQAVAFAAVDAEVR